MKKEKGYILIVTLIVMGALVLWGAFALNLYRQEQYTAQKAEMDLIAEEAARAGIEDAFYYLKTDPSWTAGFNNVLLPQSKATYSISFDKSRKDIPWSFNNYGKIETVIGWRGREVPSGSVYLVSVGKFGRSEKVMQTLITVGGGVFQDNFDRGDSAWSRIYNQQVEGTNYKVENGKYYIGPGDKNTVTGEHQVFTGKESWKDYTVEVTLSTENRIIDKTNPQMAGFGIFFRSKNVTDFSNINSYVFQYEVDRNDKVSFVYRKIFSENELYNDKSILLSVPVNTLPWTLAVLK